jgi:hypothetical protein
MTYDFGIKRKIGSHFKIGNENIYCRIEPKEKKRKKKQSPMTDWSKSENK